MLTKHKMWLGAGVAAAAVGIATGRLGDFLYPINWRRAAEASKGTASVEEGERGERVNGALNMNAADTGERGEIVARAEGGEQGVGNDSVGSDFPGGSFNDALSRVFMGEGGQGGLGISPLRNDHGAWSFSVPVLNGAQLHQAITDNSLRSENHFALHFAPSGEYRGWALLWTQQPMTRCPSKKGENYVVLERECWVATPSELDGKWAIDGDRLCLAPAPQAVTDGKECVRAALVLSSVVFFGDDGKMIRKGSDLRKGQDAARTRGG
ncbi:MAG: hypothetical protein WA803_22640 [Steroidobacteraceae bacterium]